MNTFLTMCFRNTSSKPCRHLRTIYDLNLGMHSRVSHHRNNCDVMWRWGKHKPELSRPLVINLRFFSKWDALPNLKNVSEPVNYPQGSVTLRLSTEVEFDSKRILSRLKATQQRNYLFPLVVNSNILRFTQLYSAKLYIRYAIPFHFFNRIVKSATFTRL
jgi:hypothetical protein